MNRNVKEAINYCEHSGIQQAVFAIPFKLSKGDLLALMAHSVCRGLVVGNPPAALSEASTSQSLGYFIHPGGWQLPSSKGTLVFVGYHSMLTARMALCALWSGRLKFISKVHGRFEIHYLHNFLLWRAGAKFVRGVRQMPRNNLIRKCLYSIGSTPFIQAGWTRVAGHFIRRSGLKGKSGLRGERLYFELLRRAIEQPDAEKIIPIPNRVVLVNAGLAAGGAERQILNTLIGLNKCCSYESVSLLAEYIDYAPGLDFFLQEAVENGLEVTQIGSSVAPADGRPLLKPNIAEILADLPDCMVEEIISLVQEFRIKRPSVVHAWQDSTCIKAGIAAVITGVPRIVLASRNVIPKRFTYYQDYMYPAYRALASLKSVVFVNNSEAGAVDYTTWLDLPRERFEVIRNGVDLNNLKRADDTVKREYKQKLGIPHNASVVGSIFRFWAEKRPMLWLQTASELAKIYPDLHFLIIGEGPMRREMEAYIHNNKLSGRINLPGARSDIAIPLSSMDVFVLTSEAEGTPNVVLEAQWLGLPVVVTDAGGAKESFDNGVSGMLAGDASASEISQLVSQFLNDKKLAKNAELAGPRFVERVFGLDRMIKQTVDVYESREIP
jgi:glycosyltransferase involved in cell wall biosynthesis